VPLIPGIYVAPHYGITPWYYKYNMAMAIKWHKLKQQGQDRSGLPPLNQTPIYLPTNNIPCMMFIWSLQSSNQARCEQMYIQKKCIYETNVFCS